MGPIRCTETSVNKYQSALRSEDVCHICLAVRHLNEEYKEDPNRLSLRRDAAVVMVAT
jgi:hypothetical protein